MKSNEKESITEEIIEEIDEFGNIIKFKTSELISIINEHYHNDKNSGNFNGIDYENFGKKYKIPKIICEKTKIKNYIIHKELYYNNVELLLTPITIDFIDLEGNSVIYKIYNRTYINKIIKNLNFKNPVIINI